MASWRRLTAQHNQTGLMSRTPKRGLRSSIPGGRNISRKQSEAHWKTPFRLETPPRKSRGERSPCVVNLSPVSKDRR
jgi:hypothetical protein